MVFARKAATFLAAAFLLLLPLQFLFAGYGVFSGKYDTHEIFGGMILHLIVLLTFIFLCVARQWKLSALEFGLFVAIFIQVSLVDLGRDHGDWISAFHPFMAFLYWPFVYFLIWLPLRALPNQDDGAAA